MSSINSPILIAIKSPTCVWCRELELIWDKVVTTARAKLDPNLRTFSFLNRSAEDVKNIPLKLRKYVGGELWVPMVLLVDGNEWNEAVNSPSTPGEFSRVSVLNGVITDHKISSSITYDSRLPEEIVRWLTDAYQQLFPDRNVAVREDSSKWSTDTQRQLSQDRHIVSDKVNNDHIAATCSLRLVPKYK